MKKYIVSLVVAIAALVSTFAGDINSSIELSATVSWPSEVGKFYTVRGTTDLTKWDDLENNIIGDGNVMKKTYGQKAYAFFKIVETPSIALDGKLLHKNTFTNMTFIKVSFNQSEILFVDFTSSTLNYSTFVESLIDTSVFKNVELLSAVFDRSTMMFTIFDGSSLVSTSFLDAKLYGCTFQNVDLGGSDLRGAEFYGCDFVGAVGLDVNQGHYFGCLMPDGKMRDDSQ